MAEAMTELAASVGERWQSACSWTRARFGGLGSVAEGNICLEGLGFSCSCEELLKSIMIFPTRQLDRLSIQNNGDQCFVFYFISWRA